MRILIKEGCEWARIQWHGTTNLMEDVSFYTALGHTEELFKDPLYLKHLLGGIQYAIGDNKKLDIRWTKSQPIPEENRFVKTVLYQGIFFEPTEMAILPNLDILVTQRRGEILLYSDKDKIG